MEQGDLQAADSWIDSLSLRSNNASTYLQEEVYIVLAKLQQRKGMYCEAADLLSKLAEDAEAGGRDGNLIQVLLLQAIFFNAQGLMQQALDRLEKSLILARSERYLMTFLDEGPQIEMLLGALEARGLPQALHAYVAEIIRVFARNQH